MFYLPVVCTHTDTKSPEYYKSLEKNTILNEHPVFNGIKPIPLKSWRLTSFSSWKCSLAITVNGRLLASLVGRLVCHNFLKSYASMLLTGHLFPVVRFFYEFMITDLCLLDSTDSTAAFGP